MTNHERMALDAAINPHCILDLATLAFVTVTKVPLHHLHTTLEGLMDLFRVLPPTCPHLRTCQWKFGSVSFTMSSVLPIPYFVKLVGGMPVLQDLTLRLPAFELESESRRLVEKGIMEALRLIGSRLQFLYIQERMNRDLEYECTLTGQSVEVLSALAPNLTRLICAVEVDKPSSSDPVLSFPNLQILHMRLHADRLEQASVHNWIHRWRLGTLKQFGARYGGSIPISEWAPILLRGGNGRNLEVFEVGVCIFPVPLRGASSLMSNTDIPQ